MSRTVTRVFASARIAAAVALVFRSRARAARKTGRPAQPVVRSYAPQATLCILKG